MNKPLSLLLGMVFLASPVLPQELNCTVNVNAENISSPQRDYLRTFASDVTKYMNSTRFTTEDLSGERITCTLDIFIQTASGDNQYQAQVVIGSQRPIYIGNTKTDRTTAVLRILDPSWTFTYMPNQRMIHDEVSFDALTDFLDFYAYLIIGYDLETYVPLSGAQCFQKAFNTVQIGASSPRSSDWSQSSASYSKYGIADEANNMKFAQFFTAFSNYHFDGIDMLGVDRASALDAMLKNIQAISAFRRSQNVTSVVVKQFFDAKYKEIAEDFHDYSDHSVYDRLANYDPEHRSTYDEWKAKP